MQLQDLLLNLDLNVIKATPVHGGDINAAYCLITADAKFFIKVNDHHKYPGLFEKEANGLKALAATGTVIVPQVIDHGTHGGLQYLLLEWMKPVTPDAVAWVDFGRKLAQMHLNKQPSFGFNEDNYLGTYLQDNSRTGDWASFYATNRLLPMVELLYSQGKISRETIKHANQLCDRLGELFPQEPPSLLHGDLWSGNFICTKGGTALIDPAVYCGHREIDIAMSKLFGGFAPQFYTAYNEVYPLERDWEQRLLLAQLYPLLFHAYAFGGHYVERVKAILKSF